VFLDKFYNINLIRIQALFLGCFIFSIVSLSTVPCERTELPSLPYESIVILKFFPIYNMRNAINSKGSPIVVKTITQFSALITGHFPVCLNLVLM